MNSLASLDSSCSSPRKSARACLLASSRCTGVSSAYHNPTEPSAQFPPQYGPDGLLRRFVYTGCSAEARVQCLPSTQPLPQAPTPAGRTGGREAMTCPHCPSEQIGGGSILNTHLLPSALLATFSFCPGFHPCLSPLPLLLLVIKKSFFFFQISKMDSNFATSQCMK